MLCGSNPEMSTISVDPMLCQMGSLQKGTQKAGGQVQTLVGASHSVCGAESIWGFPYMGMPPKLDGLFRGKSIYKYGWWFGVPPWLRKPPYIHGLHPRTEFVSKRKKSHAAGRHIWVLSSGCDPPLAGLMINRGMKNYPLCIGDSFIILEREIPRLEPNQPVFHGMIEGFISHCSLMFI